MDKFEYMASKLMMPIKKDLTYGRHRESRQKAIDEFSAMLSSQLEKQYLKGWNEGRQELLNELQRKVVGGHK
ncbi:hypothetical protein FAX13_06010 [Ligilactobacillus animalis]|nr:hypothetical protein FAX13_06010 [Ligilactobacillus animalis]